MVFKYVNNFRCTKEEAFDLFMDLERRPEFIDIFSESKWVTKTENMIGSTSNDKLVFIGIPLNIRYEVTHYEAYKMLRTYSPMPPFYPLFHFQIWDEEDGCAASIEIEIKLGPLEYMPKFLIKNQVDNIVEKMTRKYRRELTGNEKH